MKGVVMVTDHNWFEFLSLKHGLDEVNFWRPSDTRAPQFPVGTPILFKLKKRFGGSIVGFGIFARHDVLPAWLVWEAFEQKNGAADFEQMRTRIESLRREAADGEGAVGQYLIGCLMLAEPVFFERRDWIAPPKGWPENVVQGKSYDLLSGEGARIWEACQGLVRERHGFVEGLVADPSGERYGVPALVKPRLGQGIFRIAVTQAYGRSCAVTTEHSLPVLEAAHIRPYSEEGRHEVTNGLLLRTDIHRLFDKGYVTVTPDHRFVVSRRLKDEYANGKTYYALQGAQIHLPRDVRDHPSATNLEWHARERFRETG